MKEDTDTLPAGDKLLNGTCVCSRGEKELEVNQLCDTTGSSGMESVLDEV